MAPWYAQVVVQVDWPSSSTLKMGDKRKGRRLSRGRKRRCRGNQFVSSSAGECSESAESSSESTVDDRGVAGPSCGVSERKLSEVPSWVLGCSNSDSSGDEEELSSDPDNSSSDEDDFSEPVPMEETRGNRLIDLAALQEMLREVSVCRKCRVGDLTIRECGRNGLVPFLSVTCSNCSFSTEKGHAMGQRAGKFYDANRRSVLAMRVIGRGHAALEKFCGIMDMPKPVNESNFRRHQQAVRGAAVSAAEASMIAAATEVRENNQEAGAEDSSATAVTFDGTRMRRGFSSLYGVFACIAWGTGWVVDMTVSSKFCQACNIWSHRLEMGKISRACYNEWKQEHQDVCCSTTMSSSPAMEGDAARTLWCRSEDARSLRYLTYIGDGDSKGYSNVVQAKPYGPDQRVQKEECIGHVQKRLGTALRKLKKDLKGQKLDDGKPVGGAGRLTDGMIDTLQQYYGMAIRDNVGDLQATAKAVWAGILHRASTDDQPRHDCCPKGVGSWCGYQRVAAGADEEYVHHRTIPEAVFEVVKPIYVRLAGKDLLQRCSLGATQNQNECFNGIVWSMCPKEQFCGLGVVETAAALAVLRFNNGGISLLKVLHEMGCHRGIFTEQHLYAEDERRVAKSIVKASQAEKKRRKQRRRMRKGLEERVQDAEGETYAPGTF